MMMALLHACCLAAAVATLPQNYTCQNGQCVPNPAGLPLSECEVVCAPPQNANYTCQRGQCVISPSGLPKAKCAQVCGGPGPAPPPPPPPPPPAKYICEEGFCTICSGDDDDTFAPHPGDECLSKADCYKACGSSSIIDLAIATPGLSTFYTALKTSSVNETDGGSDDLINLLGGGLGNEGPFTVFAPSNKAFSNLPSGVLASLLKPENKAELNNVLTYHVVPGDILASALKDQEQLTTVEGKDLLVRVDPTSGSVYINDARVTTANLAASNGIVHIIDTVLIPAGPVDGNHLWFRGFTKTDPFGVYQCGEVDAGPRMPDDIFEPGNAAALKAYEAATIALFTFCNATTWGGKRTHGCAKTPFLELGRCASKNYTVVGYQPFDTVAWAPHQLMDEVCEKKCMCNFSGNTTASPLPKCQDQPDDPKAGNFCSLCGPKYNKPIEVSMFECGNLDESSCPGPNPGPGNSTSCTTRQPAPLCKSCVGRCNIPYNANLPCQCNGDYCGFFLDNCCDDYDKAC